MSTRNKNLIGAIFFLILSIVYGWYALNIQLFVTPGQTVFTARSMPVALSIIGALCSALYLISLIIGKRIREHLQQTTAGPVASVETPVETPESKNWKAVLRFFVIMIIYIMIIRYVGFIVATGLFLFAGAYLLGERRIHINAMVSIGTVIGFWLIIGKVMNIYLAEGLLWEGLF